MWGKASQSSFGDGKESSSKNMGLAGRFMESKYRVDRLYTDPIESSPSSDSTVPYCGNVPVIRNELTNLVRLVQGSTDVPVPGCSAGDRKSVV